MIKNKNQYSLTFVFYWMSIFEPTVLLLTRLRAPLPSSDVRTMARSSRHTSKRKKKKNEHTCTQADEAFEDFIWYTYMKIIHSINFRIIQVERIQIREHQNLITFSMGHLIRFFF
jgi:hypothetical protein